MSEISGKRLEAVKPAITLSDAMRTIQSEIYNNESYAWAWISDVQGILSLNGVSEALAYSATVAVVNEIFKVDVSNNRHLQASLKSIKENSVEAQEQTEHDLPTDSVHWLGRQYVKLGTLLQDPNATLDQVAACANAVNLKVAITLSEATE